MRLYAVLVACAIGTEALIGASTANASVVVLSDNFDSGKAVKNWNGDGTFEPTSGSVDLVGLGYFGQFAYPPPHSTGNSVDLDGSTSRAGTLSSIQAFGPGTYTLSFLLAGNSRGDVPKTTTISLGDWSVALALPSSSPYTDYTYTFTTSGGTLSFGDNKAGNQNIGNLLDDVILVSNGIPELSTWAMMAFGFAGLGFGAFRKGRKTNSSIA